MAHKIAPVITHGEIKGQCPQCGAGTYAGTIHADNQEVTLGCYECGHTGEYFYRWPDELPQVTLRHKSNRQLISRSIQRKKKDPNQLPGQLAFKGFKEVL